MGIIFGTARWLAPSAFFLDFVAQLYGMFSSPNMKDINDANVSFFSPQPMFVGAFFAGQQIFQLAWLYHLITMGPEHGKEDQEGLAQMLDFVPYYSAGNICIAAWMLAWNSEHLRLAQGFVTVNTFLQLFFVTMKLAPMNRRSRSSVLTHIVSKTFAGIGVLDFLHNGSAAFFKDQSATTAIKVLTGLGFCAGSALSDWIFGGCLVYDLVALSFGQQGEWRDLLGGFAAASTVIVAAKNLARPPYRTGYEAL